MRTVIYVHGIGTRREAHDKTIGTIAGRLAKHNPRLRFKDVYWGDLGCKRDQGWALPPRGQTKGMFDDREPLDEEDLAALLELDPTWELRQLAQHPDATPSLAGLFQASPPEIDLSPVEQLSGRGGWQEELRAACRSRELTGVLVELAAFHARHPDESAAAIGRAVVADALIRLPDHAPLEGFNAEQRRLWEAEVATAVLKGKTKSILVRPWDRIGRQVNDVIGAMVMPFRRSLQSVILDYALTGDILAYQSRGAAIRDLVDRAIRAETGPVIALGHSLGGVILFETLVAAALANRSLTNVETLVTVGSQTPALYHIDALATLREGEMLPAGFPRRWRNIYDEQDPVSHHLGEVFKGKRSGGVELTDHRVKTGAKFVRAHLRYWDCDETWNFFE